MSVFHLSRKSPPDPATACVGLTTLNADNPHTRNTNFAFRNKNIIGGCNAFARFDRPATIELPMIPLEFLGWRAPWYLRAERGA